MALMVRDVINYGSLTGLFPVFAFFTLHLPSVIPHLLFVIPQQQARGDRVINAE